ncbi:MULTISPECIES: TIGR04211 family SH3 domain-containing protein [Photobacterium]|uniref:Arylsulfatase n=1 Tax=Photobacterium ganghwense TaxID=320778 RepID=A0A0J1HHY9_9GAMM|nr:MULTISPECIES: TIGR04211 family SH3 domain-containing protein [Photobacterium]KLV11220.1 arylsulfatase [Photobacterium ganghwense]MBV1842658.1 SH3 domain-containing protein [Photobacterium ganghwense]PSU05154.1 SH3 domain-containing protein [Photobacterium ganghwense]QSV13765.1 SH3 domain-containing protein [Photobacterium ganghwense]
MKQLISLLVLAFAVITLPAKAEQTRYISDDLFTYMHTGPSTQYRIMGSVNAGTKVDLLEVNRETGYSKVRDDRGRTGWVSNDFISKQVGLKERVPALEKELTQVKASLADALQSTDEKTAGMQKTLQLRAKQVTDLETQNSQLNEQLMASQTEIRELRAKLDTQKDDLLMKWFTYGGMVAGGGLLFGLILPHLIPRRRKRNNGWA